MKIYVDADACPVVRIIERLAKKARRSSKKTHLKGPAKRTLEDDRRFEESFENWPPHSRDFSRELGGQRAGNGLHKGYAYGIK